MRFHAYGLLLASQFPIIILYVGKLTVKAVWHGTSHECNHAKGS